MGIEQSFLGKVFVVEDPDARIRDDANPVNYTKYMAGDQLPPGKTVGDFKVIAKGTNIKVANIVRLPTGSQSVTVLARATSQDGMRVFGLTSTRNLRGKFVNETLALLTPKTGAGQFSPTAAWSRGTYLGQVDLVEIMDGGLDIECIALSTAAPYLDMVRAAEAAGVTVAINSGFRSYLEQKYLYEGYSAGRPGFNLAAKPGRSNHQNGIAFDIAVAGGDGSPTYEWLKTNATGFGFVRTVSGEPWHWEYDVAKANHAGNNGTFKTPGVTS